MSLNADQLATQCDLELALIRGEISLAELEARSAVLGLPVADYLREPGQSTARQPITITPGMLAERAMWELKLMRGEITLDEALNMQMGIGVPIGDYTRQKYEQATSDYLAGKFSDFATPLGFATTQREKQALHTDHVTAVQAKALVDYFSDPDFRGKDDPNERATGRATRFSEADLRATRGPYPRTDPSKIGKHFHKFGKTAFHKAGEAMNKAATTVYDLYRYQGKKKRATKKK